MKKTKLLYKAFTDVQGNVINEWLNQNNIVEVLFLNRSYEKEDTPYGENTWMDVSIICRVKESK